MPHGISTQTRSGQPCTQEQKEYKRTITKYNETTKKKKEKEKKKDATYNLVLRKTHNTTTCTVGDTKSRRTFRCAACTAGSTARR